MIVRRDQPGFESNRRGAALVEFAVLLPLLMLLFVGSIEVGRAINVRQTLCEASRAGARVYSMQTRKTPDEAKEIVDQIMKQAGLENYSVTLDPPAGTTVAQLDPVSVTVTMSAADASWYPTPWFLGKDNILRAVCVMPADLEESAQGSPLDTADSVGDLVDGDDVAELSGSTNVSLQELEKEAQKLVELAKQLREQADQAYANAQAEYDDAYSEALKKAEDKLEDANKELEDAQKDLDKANSDLAKANAAKSDGDSEDYEEYYEKYEEHMEDYQKDLEDYAKDYAKYEEKLDKELDKRLDDYNDLLAAAQAKDAEATAAEAEARDALVKAAAAAP